MTLGSLLLISSSLVHPMEFSDSMLLLNSYYYILSKKNIVIVKSSVLCLVIGIEN